MKQKLKSFWENSNLWTAILCVAALLFIVVPMMYISQYVWPCSDDFEFSILTKQAFVESGNIFAVFGQAWKYMVEKYYHWQGTYSAILLMTLQPGIWGDGYYWIGVVFVFVSLLLGLFSLSYVMMVKHAKASKSIWLSITSLVSFAWFLRVMYTEEAFYWWNGASYYTGFFAWGMIMAAAMLCFYTDWETYGKVRKCFFYIISVLVGLFLAGGSYMTALMLILVGGGITVAAVYHKKKCVFVTASSTLVTVLGLLVSALAPGNIKHIDYNNTADISIMQAIFISIKDGLIYIKHWTNISVVMLFVFLVPFIWQLVTKCNCKFKMPIVATILSGGLYLSAYAPVSYAFGGFAPGRMINIYYLNFYLLLLFNVCYWLGWIARILERKKPCLLERVMQLRKKWQSVYVCVVGVLFLLSVAKVGITNTNLYWVYSELYNGYYVENDNFLKDRVSYFEEHQGEDVIVDKVPHETVITYYGDLFGYKEHLVNETMAKYYGVKSISLRE